MIWANTLSSSLTQMESLAAILSLRMVSHVYKLLYIALYVKSSDTNIRFHNSEPLSSSHCELFLYEYICFLESFLQP